MPDRACAEPAASATAKVHCLNPRPVSVLPRFVAPGSRRAPRAPTPPRSADVGAFRALEKGKCRRPSRGAPRASRAAGRHETGGGRPDLRLYRARQAAFPKTWSIPAIKGCGDSTSALVGGDVLIACGHLVTPCSAHFGRQGPCAALLLRQPRRRRAPVPRSALRRASPRRPERRRGRRLQPRTASLRRSGSGRRGEASLRRARPARRGRQKTSDPHARPRARASVSARRARPRRETRRGVAVRGAAGKGKSARSRALCLAGAHLPL